MSEPTNERLLVGLLIVAPHRLPEALARVDPGDFEDRRCRIVIERLKTLHENGFERWHMGDLMTIGVEPKWLAETIEMSPLHLRPVLDEVAKATVRRRSMTAAQRMHARMHAGQEDPRAVLAETQAEVDDLRKKAMAEGPVAMTDILESVFRRIAQAKVGQRQPITLGPAFHHVTREIGGFLPGRMHVLAARPAVGKTAVAMSWAFDGNSKRPLFITSEMTREDLVMRLVSQLSGVSQPRLERGDFDEQDWGALEEAKARIEQRGVEVLEAHGKTADEAAEQVTALHERNPFDLVIHDYLQLFRGNERSRSEYDDVRQASKAMMTMAQKLDVPLIQLAQLNRELEKRDDPKPRLSDLRGSGTIEQDAWMIFFLHRPHDFAARKPGARGANDPNALQILLQKNRSGPRGEWFVETDFATYRFSRPLKAVS